MPAPSFYREIRERFKLSQTEMSRWLGVGYQYVQSVEAGRSIPPVPFQLCYVFLSLARDAELALQQGHIDDAMKILQAMSPTKKS